MANQIVPDDRGAVTAKQYGYERSPEWPKVAEEHLKTEPHCVACKPGTNPQAKLQVHRIFPFQYCIALGRPDLELDQRNLITLCENEKDHPADDHHLLVGHLDEFKSFNPDVEQDARTTFHGMTAAEIRTDSRWNQKVAVRPKPLEEMTTQEKANLLAEMNKRFPKKTN